MDKPVVFISHKHADRAIANVVRSFVTEHTSGNVAVFQSSDPVSMAPAVGRPLNEELRRALWEAGAVILCYTTQDQDWGYCMWECGVATNPNSPDTKIILFQCADSAPKLFEGQVFVNARDRASIEAFTIQFMTEPRFLARRDHPLTGFERSGPEVKRAANKLFDDLQAVLPEWPVAEWPAHPYIQLEMSAEGARRIADMAPEQRLEEACHIVLAEATVTDSDRYASALFSLTRFENGTTLKRLSDIWQTAFPRRVPQWAHSLADQIAKAAQWHFPVLRWAAMEAVGHEDLRAPVVTRVRRLPPSKYQFDVYFYPFNLLDATPVSSRMIKPEDMLRTKIEAGGESAIKVTAILDRLDELRLKRMPFFDSDGRLMYIGHRSALDGFLSRHVRRGSPIAWSELTLAEAFTAEPELRRTFMCTAAFVGENATMGDAKLAMNATPDCYDVFITANGQRNESVLGWVTDVMIAAGDTN